MNDVETRSPPCPFLKEQGIPFLTDEPLRNHCTWRIGGPADCLVEPSSWEQVAAVLRYAGDCGIPAVVIGKGSNLLFDDAGLRGVVVKIGRRLARFTISGTTIRAQSGVSASRIARAAGLAGLSGLEHIVGIPGTLGGLVFMNGGSLRKEIGDSIVGVRTMDRRGNMRVLRREECEFGYRHSRFQNEDCVVTEATMELVPGRRSAILAEMLAILRERRRKLPMTLPNCGSVFRNDPQLYEAFGPPGKIIEGLGLKGLRIGGAMVDVKHANFIVNVGSARAADVLALVARIRERMHERLGVTLPCEAEYVNACGVIESLGKSAV